MNITGVVSCSESSVRGGSYRCLLRTDAGDVLARLNKGQVAAPLDIGQTISIGGAATLLDGPIRLRVSVDSWRTADASILDDFTTQDLAYHYSGLHRSGVFLNENPSVSIRYGFQELSAQFWGASHSSSLDGLLAPRNVTAAAGALAMRGADTHTFEDMAGICSLGFFGMTKSSGVLAMRNWLAKGSADLCDARSLNTLRLARYEWLAANPRWKLMPRGELKESLYALSSRFPEVGDVIGGAVDALDRVTLPRELLSKVRREQVVRASYGSMMDQGAHISRLAGLHSPALDRTRWRAQCQRMDLACPSTINGWTPREEIEALAISKGSQSPHVTPLPWLSRLRPLLDEPGERKGVCPTPWGATESPGSPAKTALMGLSSLRHYSVIEKALLLAGHNEGERDYFNGPGSQAAARPH